MPGNQLPSDDAGGSSGGGGPGLADAGIGKRDRSTASRSSQPASPRNLMSPSSPSFSSLSVSPQHPPSPSPQQGLSGSAFPNSQPGQGGWSTSGPLSPGASSASASFVFPVRSIFQNMNAGGSGNVQPSASSHGLTGQRRSVVGGGGSPGGGALAPRGTSNASDHSSFRTHGSATSELSEANESINQSPTSRFRALGVGASATPFSGGTGRGQPSGHPKPDPTPIQDSRQSQGASSSSIESTESGSGLSTSTIHPGPLSAPLPKNGDGSGYFEAGRRMSDTSPSVRMMGREGSWIGRSTKNQEEPSGQSFEKTGEDQSEQEESVQPHAHGQVDPIDDEPAPPQTTEKIDEGKFKFSHYPGGEGGGDPRAPESTSVDANTLGKDIATSDLRHPRPRIATTSDEMEDLVHGEGAEGKRKISGPTVEKIRTEQRAAEPDVGPSSYTRKEERDTTSMGEQLATEIQHKSLGETADPPPSDLANIVRLGQAGDTSVAGRHSNLDSQEKSTDGSGSQKQIFPLAQHNTAVDHQQNTQAFVTRQSETTDHIDPNTSSSDERDLSGRSSSAGTSASQNNLSSEDTNAANRNPSDTQMSTRRESSSQGISSIDEPVMTVKFEHVTTDDGHHVVMGREGKLEKCEDEPITTPGAVQGFGVLMVLQEDEDTGDLAVRQVSENCTELLGLSPRYLFRLQCFTHILPRSQDHALRDNIDYLPDPDVGEADNNEEGPQVFLLSGYGEPGSDDSDEPPSERTLNRRREWTCWVAAHRPSQKSWDLQDEQGRQIPPPNIIVLEFELERDIYNPLYPPGDPSDADSHTESPASGSATTGSDGRTSSQGSMSTGGSTASDSTMGRKHSASGEQLDRPTTNLKTIQENTVTKHEAVRQGSSVMGLEGEDFDMNAEDILESTTSYAKPLRALERMRRMTRTARGQIQAVPSGRAGPGAGKRQSRRDGAGSGGVGTMDVFAVLAQINDQLGAAPDIESFLKVVVGVIKDLTQFHRCLVYSFDAHWNGQVVAELVDWSATHDLYKGLMFPMTDIPAQARELYRINKVRLLYDRAQTTARMVLRSKSDLDHPLDMTHSYLRAMSPIHLVYLKNMGVRSSMSISIMAFGSLWGLIALHGYGNAGMRVSFPVRQMLRLLSDSISRNIERLSYAARLHTRKLISTIPTDAHPTGYIVSNADDLIQLFDADSGVLVIGDGAKILGPSSEHGQEILLIAEFLRLKRYENMQISHNISEDFPELRSPKTLDVISGLLYVPLSARGNDFIAFLRKGQLRKVHWAGKPYKEGKEKGANLEPRQSFKSWSETIAGRSRVWTDEQLETAGVLALVYGKFIEVWRQKESAMRTNQMTSILLTNASHEVRTPLNHIINYLELALDGQLDSETRENLSRSHLASKSLLFTINDLLDLTRIESGNETAFNDPFDLRSCIQDATRVYASEAKRRGLQFEVELHNAPDCMVLGDLRKIRTVVANLVANAVKYTSDGKIQISCRGREPTESGRSGFEAGMLDVEIVVSDTGLGIASDKLEAMFVTFEQAETAPHQAQATGLGLGLAVVARIVEQLGGQLRAESEVGVGTRFYFTLLMARHMLEATDSHSYGSGSIRKSILSSRGSLFNSPGSDDMKVIPPGGSATSEVDTFVEALGVSHIRAPADDERIRAAEARMNQPGTFPVADSSWPVKPTKVDLAPVEPQSASTGPKRGTPPSRQSSGGRGEAEHTHVHRHSPKPLPQRSDRGGPSEKKSKLVRSTGERMRILVVEDDDVNRRILERRLQLDGHTVLSDVNGQEAVDRIKADCAFDCILMDIQMPVMDGRQSATAIRKYEQTFDTPEHSSSSNRRVNHRIPIIAVSASLQQEQRVELAVNFDGWMLKPIDFKRMLHILGGLSDPARRQGSGFVPGQWERGGWFNVESRD